MKKALFGLLAGCFILAGTATPCSAQKYKGEFVVQANAGFSLVGSAIRIAFKVSDYAIQGLDTRSTPGLSGTIDFGLTDRLSIGGAYFIQVASANWTGFTDTILDSIYVGDFNFRAQRNNYGVRALFHLGNNDQIDSYFGIRLGFSHWKLTTDVSNFELLNLKFARNLPSFQVLFGFRYFILPFLGVNAEVGFGSPYFLSTGICVRFGGQK